MTLRAAFSEYHLPSRHLCLELRGALRVRASSQEETLHLVRVCMRFLYTGVEPEKALPRGLGSAAW